MNYLKIETSDKEKIVSLLKDTIEQSILHRIYTRKLENGNYEIEIIASGEEPLIT